MTLDYSLSLIYFKKKCEFLLNCVIVITISYILLQSILNGKSPILTTEIQLSTKRLMCVYNIYIYVYFYACFYASFKISV